jgi:hypothetical protein
LNHGKLLFETEFAANSSPMRSQRRLVRQTAAEVGSRSLLSCPLLSKARVPPHTAQRFSPIAIMGPLFRRWNGTVIRTGLKHSNQIPGGNSTTPLSPGLETSYHVKANLRVKLCGILYRSYRPIVVSNLFDRLKGWGAQATSKFCALA